MTVFSDNGNRTGGYIISEDDGATGGAYSRDVGVLASGTVGASGLVVASTATLNKFTVLTTLLVDSAAAILFSPTDAALADKKAVFSTRRTEVNDAELIWPAGLSAPDKSKAVAALKLKGIIVR